jgi:AcrR family transcriptional regulator
MRADARRNRERVLAAAREAFAQAGPAVGLDDIARRAGVGAGTVHRHFPSKQALFTAVVTDRLIELTERAQALRNVGDAGAAFFDVLHRIVEAARENLAISAALAGGGEIGLPVRQAGSVLTARLAALLARAQAAGAVRGDLTAAELPALICGVVTMEQRLPPASRGRGEAIVRDGLAGVGSGTGPGNRRR